MLLPLLQDCLEARWLQLDCSGQLRPWWVDCLVLLLMVRLSCLPIIISNLIKYFTVDGTTKTAMLTSSSLFMSAPTPAPGLFGTAPAPATSGFGGF